MDGGTDGDGWRWMDGDGFGWMEMDGLMNRGMDSETILSFNMWM